MKKWIVPIILFVVINFNFCCGKKELLKEPFESVPNIQIRKTPEIQTVRETKIDIPLRKEKSFYVVGNWKKDRDCLWNISFKVYHNPWFWPEIYKANTNQIKNPDLIYPKQILAIPTIGQGWETGLSCPLCNQDNLRKKYVNIGIWEYTCPTCLYIEWMTR